MKKTYGHSGKVGENIWLMCLNGNPYERRKRNEQRQNKLGNEKCSDTVGCEGQTRKKNERIGTKIVYEKRLPDDSLWVKVDSDKAIEVSKREGRGRSSKGARSDERKGEVRNEGRICREGEAEGERAWGERKKVSVHVIENEPGADRVRGWHEEIAKGNNGQGEKSFNGSDGIGVDVTESMR